MRSIELVFDSATDSAIRADWSRLAAAGFSSLAAHTAASNRPHITLAAGMDLQVPADLRGFREVLPLDIQFPGIQIFPAGAGRYVLARSVAVTAKLLALHRLVHNETPEPLLFTQPRTWTPHVTLARRIREEQLGAAVGLLELRLEGQCTGARLWDSGPKTITSL